MRPLASVIALLALVVASCDATVGGSGALEPAIASTTSPSVVDPIDTSTVDTTTTSASPGDEPAEEPPAQVRLVEVPEEPPPWEDVTITTEDGLNLTARFWEGGDVAVLHLHDFDNPTPGSAGQRAPQTSESIIRWSAALVESGFTVLSPEWRGHGDADGDFEPQASPADFAAFHSWLRDAGYDTIVVIGWAGAATASIVTVAENEDMAVDGIAFLFSPPQDHGLDANAVLDEAELPTLFVGSQAGRSASWANRMGNKALNATDIVIFDRVPSGLQFIDVFGPELAGHLVTFVESAAG